MYTVSMPTVHSYTHTRQSGDHSTHVAQHSNNPQLTVAPHIHCAQDTQTLKQCSFIVGQRWTLDQQLY